MNKAVFIDKDGTLIINVHYNVDPERIIFTPKAIAGLQLLHRMGYLLIVVTNQQGVGLGYFPEEALLPVQEKLTTMLAKQNITLSGFYYCPHLANAGCSCRKPMSGLLKQAARDHHIDLTDSWMIGDTPADIQAGLTAGCRAILFDKGYENDWNFRDDKRPERTVTSLTEAAAYILSQVTCFKNRQETL